MDIVLNGASFLLAIPDADPDADALWPVAAAAPLLAALAWRYSGKASTSPETPSSFDSSVCQQREGNNGGHDRRRYESDTVTGSGELEAT